MTIQVTELPGGLRVVSDTMDTVESVSLGAWIEVGNRDEAPAINGISHLLEHMAFKGTERRSALEIAEEIEAVGGHLNAYTSHPETYAAGAAGDHRYPVFEFLHRFLPDMGMFTGYHQPSASLIVAASAKGDRETTRRVPLP